MKQRCINVVPTLCNVASTLCNVVLTLFQRRALTLYQRCATSKICRRILLHFQRRINVIWTLIHNVETTLIRRWNVDLELSTVLYFPEELFTFTEEILIVELPFFTLLTRSLYDYLSKGKQQRFTALLPKQPVADVPWSRCSWKFRKFHGKTPVLESTFNKTPGLKGLQHR